MHDAGQDTRDELDLARLLAPPHGALVDHRACVVVAAVGIAILQAQDETRKTFEGRTLTYLGQPVTPTGQPATNAPAAQPLFAQQVVRSQAALANAAAAAGLAPGALAGRVSIGAASGTLGRPQHAGAVRERDRARPWGAKQVAAASQSLADEVVTQSGAYQADKKRAPGGHERPRSRSASRCCARSATPPRSALAAVPDDPSVSATERLVAQQGALDTIQGSLMLEGQLSQQLYDAQSALASVDFNEAPRVIQPARGRASTSPRDRRTSSWP